MYQPMHSLNWALLISLVFIVGRLATTRGIFTDVEKVQVSVSGDIKIARVGENFICATLDWWPPEKCDYGVCSWGYASLLNMDLKNPILQSAVKGLSPLLLRLGGSLQDQVVYNVGEFQHPCNSFVKAPGLFGFSQGCLSMSRWQELNEFFHWTGSKVAFGLNALYGREQNTSLAWDSSNAQSFIQHTADNFYPVYAWEFGNELSSSGIGAKLSVSQYVNDIKELRSIIDRIYAEWKEKPLVVAPDGFFEKSWYTNLLQETGAQVLDACTHHIYNLGPGISTNFLDSRILDPEVLNNVLGVFDQLRQTMQIYGPWAEAWVGESGGAYNSGQHLTSDSFLFSFWYVDQLGMAATFNTQVYCRQTLVGGNYGLLNTTTFQPNPDYYSALLWKQLMGREVLATIVIAASNLRAYAHCARGDTHAVTVVLINLSSNMTYSIDLSLANSTSSNEQVQSAGIRISFLKDFFKSTARSKTVDIQTKRLEYHLTAPSGDLHSQQVLLNGKILQLKADGSIPNLVPILAESSNLVQVAPTSIVFVKLPNVFTPACSIP